MICPTFESTKSLLVFCVFFICFSDTSRPIRVDEIDGKVYHFASRERMEADIADNAYLEWGEFGGHLYGTKLDSIREISNKGRMVILDCSPQVSISITL